MQLFAQLESLGGWLVNPGLLAAGACAMSLPLLIHLFNRRRFQVVPWAAMEFLLVAELENRRRLRLENLLLLCLRCLAVFLIGMMLARPLLPGGGFPALVDTGRFERIVLLDDSLSMQAKVGIESAWDVARRRLADLAEELAAEQADNSLTVVLASQPESPYIDALPLRADSLGDLRKRIESLACSYRRVDLGAALEAFAGRLEADRTDANRVVYVLSDLRAVDWGGPPEASAAEHEVQRQLRRLSSRVQGCTLVDVAGGEDVAGRDNVAGGDDQNLSIVDVRTDGILMAGVPSALEVVVKNQGSTRASGILVTMQAEGALPVEMPLEALAPQESAAARFPIVLDESRKITFAVAGAAAFADRLAADDKAFLPARVTAGIPVLVIDGDPLAADGQGESLFLRRALAPEGPIPSGVITSVMAADEAATANLQDFQVIFLLDADQLGDAPAEAAARLEQWVLAGGGLVMLPGDRVHAPTFNRHFLKPGSGLAPLQLAAARGDESQETWASVFVSPGQQSVMSQFAGRDNPLLRGVKVFRWWQAEAQENADDAGVLIAARLDEGLRVPLVAEKPYGRGRVIMFTIPADDAWHNWPGDPSYLLLMQDLVRSLAAKSVERDRVQIGEPIVQAVDLAAYQDLARFFGPDEAPVELKAAFAEQQANADDRADWKFTAPAASKPGFYSLVLTSRDGSQAEKLFAANVSPAEGDLRRVDERAMESLLAESNIRIVRAAENRPLVASSNRQEVSRQLLWLVISLLATEQALGWWFGRRRT